ncbi:MAG: helix-hairpin-helix domain-containing protein [Thermodesulfovibrionales bacterium]
MGEHAARLLARNFARLEDLYRVTPERILCIKQMGEKIAASVASFFGDAKNSETLASLLSLGVRLTNPDFVSVEKASLPLGGLAFVITGTLPVPRKEVEDLIERQGGRSSAALSRKTDYLVAGEEPGSKLRKAGELGVKVISYDELQRMVRREAENLRLFE